MILCGQVTASWAAGAIANAIKSQYRMVTRGGARIKTCLNAIITHCRRGLRCSNLRRATCPNHLVSGKLAVTGVDLTSLIVTRASRIRRAEALHVWRAGGSKNAIIRKEAGAGAHEGFCAADAADVALEDGVCQQLHGERKHRRMVV